MLLRQFLKLNSHGLSKNTSDSSTYVTISPRAFKKFESAWTWKSSDSQAPPAPKITAHPAWSRRPSYPSVSRIVPTWTPSARHTLGVPEQSIVKGKWLLGECSLSFLKRRHASRGVLPRVVDHVVCLTTREVQKYFVYLLQDELQVLDSSLLVRRSRQEFTIGQLVVISSVWSAAQRQLSWNCTEFMLNLIHCLLHGHRHRSSSWWSFTRAPPAFRRTQDRHAVESPANFTNQRHNRWIEQRSARSLTTSATNATKRYATMMK